MPHYKSVSDDLTLKLSYGIYFSKTAIVDAYTVVKFNWTSRNVIISAKRPAVLLILALVVETELTRNVTCVIKPADKNLNLPLFTTSTLQKIFSHKRSSGT